MVNYFNKLNEYNDWANRRVLRAMHSANDPEPRILTLYNHIVAAQQLWLARIEGGDYKKLSAWTEIPLNELDGLSEESTQDWTNFLQGLNDSELGSIRLYKDSEGNEYENTLKDILAHVFNHSTYHRAQINQLLRKGGAEPAITDYIMFVRNRVKA